MTRTNFFYTVGKSETELFAYDEYDSKGSGIYFTGDALMYERWNILEEAIETAKKYKLKVYLVEIQANDPPILDLAPDHRITIDLQWEENDQ